MLMLLFRYSSLPKRSARVSMLCCVFLTFVGMFQLLILEKSRLGQLGAAIHVYVFPQIFGHDSY